MGCAETALNLFTSMSMVEESTPCEFEVGGAFDSYHLTNSTIARGGDVVDSESRDPYGAQDAEVVNTFADPTVMAELRAEHYNTWWQWVFRDLYPPDLEVVGVANVDMVTGATFQDGTTGWAIQAPTGTLASLIARDNLEQAPIRTSGFANAANDGFRRAAYAWNTGALDQIDLLPDYTSNPTAGEFGEVPVAETGASATINVGATIRDGQARDAVRLSGVIEWPDFPSGARYLRLFGMLPSSLTLTIEGSNAIMLEMALAAKGIGPDGGADQLEDAFPGGGSVVDAVGYHNRFTVANSTGLQGFYVNGWNAALSGDTLTSATLTFDGAPTDGRVAGSDDRGVQNVTHITPTIQFDTYASPDIEKYLSGYTIRGAPKASFDVVIGFPDSTEKMWITIPRATFNPDGGIAAEGTERATAGYTARGSRSSTASRAVLVTIFEA